jgi:hypothetical protein
MLYPIYTNLTTGIDYLSIENNVFYSNGTNAPFHAGTAPTHNTTQNNLTSNPSFNSSSDLHLRSNSPAIHTGIYVGLTTDYDGSLWNNPPSIGAYEYSYDVSYSAPTVTTAAVTDISVYTATGGGNVTHDGSALTYSGICWSTLINPTLSDPSIQDPITGEGGYTLPITGLNASTHYHVRAFAYNYVGISYGIDVSFNTYAAPNVSTGRAPNLFLAPNNKYYTFNGKYLIR